MVVLFLRQNKTQTINLKNEINNKWSLQVKYFFILHSSVKRLIKELNSSTVFRLFDPHTLIFWVNCNSLENQFNVFTFYRTRRQHSNVPLRYAYTISKNHFITSSVLYLAIHSLHQVDGVCLALPGHGAQKPLYHIFLPLNPADKRLDGWCRYMASFPGTHAPTFYYIGLS